MFKNLLTISCVFNPDSDTSQALGPFSNNLKDSIRTGISVMYSYAWRNFWGLLPAEELAIL